MRPQRQTRFGGLDAPPDEQGNCFSASIATIFDIDLDDVPMFVDNDTWFEEFQVWAEEHLGHRPLVFEFTEWNVHCFHGCLVEAGGKSPRGDFDHSVVWRVGEGMVFDPHPSDDGLVGGAKTFTIFVPIEPCVAVAR